MPCEHVWISSGQMNIRWDASCDEDECARRRRWSPEELVVWQCRDCGSAGIDCEACEGSGCEYVADMDPGYGVHEECEHCAGAGVVVAGTFPLDRGLNRSDS